ncbi:hypothetical protein [Streptomyces decoyicus]|uniref:hypothetical protein n=1 Tax=Streptomyces decoyicus TaxID=249567 RepID=UPI00382D8570
MQKKIDPWSGARGDDTWGNTGGIGIGIDSVDASLYYSQTWAGAENQQNFMLKHGGEEVPQYRARPGDIIHYEQQGPNGEIEHVNTPHAAVVTAVMPDGEVKYTQHQDSV